MKSRGLSDTEKRRYEKHIMLPEIGERGQLLLKEARVLVVGAGGLGCPALQYLCAAGIGNIGIVEFDVVNDTNLQRQILYGTGDVGKLKSIITRDKLIQQNNSVNIEIFNIRLDSGNALSIIEQFDVVIDATDNYESRYTINDCSLISNKPMVHGAIYKYEGQASVFNYKNGPTYRCYNPQEAMPEKNPDPSDAGLLGVLPGITGTIMASEAIKIILGMDDILSGRVLIFNILNNNYYSISINPRKENKKIDKLLAIYKNN
jgi:molybdopterin/thiamine biosynthesis adenylyltransferase